MSAATQPTTVPLGNATGSAAPVARRVAVVRAVRWIKDRLSYANVVATLALFIAMGGASDAALNLPPNSVGPRQLKRDAVTPGKLAFPLGLAAGLQPPGERTITAGECPPGVLCPAHKPDILTSTSLTLRRPAKVLLFGSALFMVHSSSATIAIHFGALINKNDERARDEGVTGARTLSFQTVVAEPAGRMTIALEARGGAQAPTTVGVYNAEVAAVVLPEIK